MPIIATPAQKKSEPKCLSADLTCMTAQKISSPCRNVCKLDAQQKWCTGCDRTIDEILVWGRLSETERVRIMESLPERRAQRDGVR